LQALRLKGCGRIIAVDIDDAKLDMARRLGADETINSRTSAVPHAVADVAVEAVGATQPIQTAIASVRKGGAVTLIGNVSPTVELPLQSVVTRQIRLIGSCASSGEYPACIELLGRGAIRVEPMITARASLDQGVEWFERLYSREPNLMKVILEP
jgi:L-iditol 2-dehydrogenase